MSKLQQLFDNWYAKATEEDKQAYYDELARHHKLSNSWILSDKILYINKSRTFYIGKNPWFYVLPTITLYPRELVIHFDWLFWTIWFGKEKEL
jgi:hypothetical protein